MPTIGWLLAAAGAWAALVCAICLLLTVAKRADARLHTPPGRLEGPLAGGPAVNGAPDRLEPRFDGLDSPSARDVYWLYVRDEPVAQLRWRVGAGRAPGWYLWRPDGGWRRVAVDPGLDAGFAAVPPHPGWHEAADLAASVSAALALDAAANLLCGPCEPSSRLLRSGQYELHASGLATEVVPIAFPEAIIVRHGDVSVLAGHFDDPGLAVLTRRIAILGGRLLALFPADPTPVDGQPL